MVEDLLRKYVKPVDEPEANEPSLIRGEAPLPRIEIREPSGNSWSFPYAALQRAALNPSVGIRLDFGETVVNLGGVNLQPLFAAVHGQSAKSILLLSEDAAATAGETIVNSCSFEHSTRGDSE